MYPPPTLILSTSVAVLFAYTWLRYNKKHKLPLPPGPQGYPLIGNIIHRPKEYEWKVYAEWGRVYDSPILSTNLFGYSFIILNTSEAVNDLLEKRSAMYSDRPQMPSFEMLGLDQWDIPLFQYGSLWRTCRRLMHQDFHAAATVQYYAHSTRATNKFLRQLLSKPEEFVKHIKHMAGATILSITYGIDVLEENDPYMALAEKQIEAALKLTHPGFLVDFIPILRYVPSWFPGGGFQTVMQYYKEQGQLMMNQPLAYAREQIELNMHTPSFISHSLARREDELDSHTQKEDADVEGHQEHEDALLYEKALKASSSSLYIAGSDTTTSTLTTAILGLVSSPFALQQAQAQIDALLHGTRLPTFEDMSELTWVTAIVLESLRWQPVAPMSIPHYTLVEDEYKGYRIPAGSIIFPNTWAILHDPEAYPSPHLFKPERFLSEDGTIRRDVKDPATAAFGYGRRICIGRFMAQNSMWIAVACMIASFDIRKKKDGHGQFIEPSYAVSNGMLSYPEPFQCDIVPRSWGARILVEDTTKEEIQ